MELGQAFGKLLMETDRSLFAVQEGMGRAFGATEMEAHGAEQRMEGQMEMDAAKVGFCDLIVALGGNCEPDGARPQAQKEAKGTHKVHEGQMKEAYGAPGQGVTGSMESMGGRVERNL